jgi:hypothetical protein
MANENHVEVVKQGSRSIAEWREQHSGERLDLRGANLRRAVLTHADLSGADLSGASLRWADFRWADLVGVNFSSADLWHADFQKAELIHAIFRDTDLRGTNFEDADLAGADFTGAMFGKTRLLDTDLGSAVGLAEARHECASNINEETITKSGMLPRLFLRGCGLSEKEIVVMELHDGSVPEGRANWLRSEILRHESAGDEYYPVFISYSHEDEKFASFLHDSLQERGVRCWLDKHQLLPGDDIYEQVHRGVGEWGKFLLCCSKSSLTSWWVDHEMDLAFAKERQLMRERGRKVLALIPLNLDGFMFDESWQSGKKQEVLSRLAADFRDWESSPQKRNQELERLVRSLGVNQDEVRDSPPRSSRL